MEFTIVYHSAKAEVMRWYWKVWKQKLWQIHVLAFLLASAVASIFLRGASDTYAHIAWSAIAGFAVIVFFALYPLAAFKSQLRTLVVNESGIKTSIGAKSGQLGWGEVRSIERVDGCIYIVRKNYNSYIVPRRAFTSEAEMGQFLASITAWHGGVAG
ncbi:YcxB family protein [Paraherbaspirillum soli]|uniref:YcxB family protein n=1 Tax=Paraherbaspirillum soli TaxID=631222 RepID=A0ABW0M7H9_9BURK